jgi:signal transduction histidine kinase
MDFGPTGATAPGNGSTAGTGLTAAVADIQVEQQQWRERVLTGLGWTSAAAATIGGALLLFSGDWPVAVVWASCLVAFVLVAMLRGRLAFRARVWLLIAPLCVSGGLVVPLLEGFVPNTAFAVGGAVVVTTLLLGRHWGLAVLAFGSIAILVVGLLHGAGVVGVLPGYEAFAAYSPMFVARTVFGLAIISASLVVAVSYLLSRAEGLLVEKAGALERLREEQGEAQRVREELARQEAAFRKARELEILGRLAGSVAHDFNNALLVIQNNVDLIRHQPDFLITGLGQIDEAVRQAVSTTRQLSGFTHEAPAPRKPVGLGATAARAAKLLERVLPSNITVTVTVDDGVTVLADEGRLQGIVTNLALNARDAMSRGGKLDVCVRKATSAEVEAVGLGAPCALMGVSDDGIGMSEETRAHLFEPYFTTKGAAGTGLGLASVKSAVEAGGGRILVTSAPGQGTQVRILWPLYEGSASGTGEPETTEPRVCTGTVLLVEDNEPARVAMARVLAARGFTVLEASSGGEALTIARRYRAPIDVLCSDCVMPGVGVQQMLDGFRALFPKARVLLCSAYAPEDVAPPLETVDAFAAKPFAPDAFVRLVGGLVARAQDAADRGDGVPPHDGGVATVTSGGSKR